MKNVCFTGHRNSPNTPEMRFYIKNLLEELIVLDGADTFYAGGAKGWDNDCSDIVLEMQKEFRYLHSIYNFKCRFCVILISNNKRCYATCNLYKFKQYIKNRSQ